MTNFAAEQAETYRDHTVIRFTDGSVRVYDANGKHAFDVASFEVAAVAIDGMLDGPIAFEE